MTELTSDELGSLFEARIAAELGGQKIPQSGAGKFWKLDVKDTCFIWSCKATRKQSIRVSKNMLIEAMRVARSRIGGGGGAIGGLALEVDGMAYVMLPLEAFKELATTDNLKYIERSKVDERLKKKKSFF